MPAVFVGSAPATARLARIGPRSLTTSAAPQAGKVRAARQRTKRATRLAGQWYDAKISRSEISSHVTNVEGEVAKCHGARYEWQRQSCIQSLEVSRARSQWTERKF